MLVKLRFRFPEVVFGILLAVAIFAMGAIFASSYQSPSGEQNTPTEQKTKKESPANGPKAQSLWAPTDSVGLYTLVLSVFTGVLALVSIFQGIMLLRADKTARVSADAAMLNARTLMTVDGAVIYPILSFDNLEMRIAAINFGIENQGVGPFVTYHFRNYGKTPATLTSIMHGMDYFEEPSSLRTMHIEDQQPLEILGPGEISANYRVELSRIFTEEMRQAVNEFRSQLLLFGEASFTDFFNRKFRCIWECQGTASGFKLTRHEQREDPDT